MKLFSVLETNPTAYEMVQRVVTLNYRAFLRTLREEGFFEGAKSYLDIGCGTGFLRDYLLDADYLGADLNPRYIAEAKRLRGDRFLVADVLEIGRLAKRFDRIVGVGLLHHLDDGQVRTVLAQCVTLLNPGGAIFVLDAMWPPGKNPVGLALRRSDNGAHVRTLPEWEKLFGSVLEIATSRAVSQWPFDYVFVKAIPQTDNARA